MTGEIDKMSIQSTNVAAISAVSLTTSEIVEKLIHNGYRPVPCSGKRPVEKSWPTRAFKPSDFRQGKNVGIKTGQGIALIDIDVTDDEAVTAIVSEWERRHPGGMQRTGLAPKTAFLVASDLERKIDLKLSDLPMDQKGNHQKVEVLANGQQFIAYGIHPDTKEPYYWHGLPSLEPLQGCKDELQFVTSAEINDFVRWVEGKYAKQNKSLSQQTAEASAPTAKKVEGKADSPFQRVNAAALADLDAWVPNLLPQANKQSTGGWRVSSKDLGRDFEEDLSIHPTGIQDYGRELSYTPINLVLHYLGDNVTSAKQAAYWICEQLDVSPIDIGFTNSMGLPNWAQGWVYNEKLLEFHQLETGHSIKSAGFNAKFNRKPEVGDESSAAAFVLNSMRTVANTMFWPCEDDIITYAGLDYVNNYKRPHLTAAEASDDEAKAALQRVINHAHDIVAEPEDAEILLNFLAFVYQNPEKRVRWAILLFGIQGNGKSFFVEMMKRLLGHNAREVAGTTVAQRFTGWAVNKLFIAIEEIRVPSESKYAVLDKLKPFISNDEINVEQKGQDDRVVPNFASYMLLTNHDDALPLDDDDRRYCIIETRHRTKADIPSPDYFDALFGALDGHTAAIAHYFATREIPSTFKPNGRAPETRGRFRMIEESKTSYRLAVEEAIAEINCDVVNDGFVYVSALRSEAWHLTDITLPDQRGIGQQLKDMGYIKHTVGKHAKGPRVVGKERTIYYRPSETDPRRFMPIVQAYINATGGG